MKRNSKRWEKLLFPPLWVIVLFVMVSIVGLIALSLTDYENHPIAYVLYISATYSLTVACAFAVKTIPAMVRKARNGIYTNPLGNRYMTDASFKVRVSLYANLTINLAYSVFKLITGIVYSSFWWGAIAVYYMLLSLMRFLLLYYMERKQGEKSLLLDFRSYQLCGILLLTINLALSAIVYQMVRDSKGFTYPEGIILIAAMYTFYNVTVSIIELIRYRKYKSPVMSASKAIRFAAALVSLLSLETAMLTVYGSDAVLYKTMTAWTGAGVCIIVSLMSVYMILRASAEVKRIKANQT